MEEIAESYQEVKKSFVVLPRSTASAVNSKRRRISRLRIPRGAAVLAATLPAMKWIPIPPYAVIVTEIKRDIMMNVGR